MPFEKIIDKAWKMGIRKYVTEFWYLGGEDWKQDLAQSNQKMRAILDRQE